MKVAVCFFVMLLTVPTFGDELPVLLREDFESGAKRWKPTDATAWELRESDGDHEFHQHKKQSAYQPPHRSPFHIAVLSVQVPEQFVFDAMVQSTHPDYGHRDVCVFFGYQDPAHFYYVHFGKEMDDHANQIFIVNEAPRTKISQTTTSGTNWDDQWHHVRVQRDDAGKIEVFFDDMEKPVMTATDRTFGSGRIGIGSFDDTSAWDDIVIRGKKTTPGPVTRQSATITLDPEDR